MKQFVKKFLVNGLTLVCGFFILDQQVLAQQSATKLDDFERANSLVVGTPATGNFNSWLETETGVSNDFRARVENNMLVLGSHNNLAQGASGLEQVSMHVAGKYATVFNQAASALTWAFNFRQNRSGTSGFGATTYGMAYVLGSSKPVFNDPDAVGYAVIIGNASSPDPVKLVRFRNGLTANSNITTIASSSEITETAYYSVKVVFEPCSQTWSLQVRNDNGTFSDPLNNNAATVSATDQTYTSQSLDYTGAAYNHGTVNVTAFFDNIYVPVAQALQAIYYNWNGQTSSDFSEPSNWTPARTCVRAIDVLSFNSGGNIGVMNVSTQEIGQLLLTNNTTVSLRAAVAAGTQTLSLAGNTGTDLLVEAGSNLFIDSNDPLEISLKTGATATVAGSVTFQNTSSNLGRAHRLLAADAHSVVFENGSQFVAKNLTGEPFGNNGTANVVVFKANATYFSKDGASPFGLASPNSKVIFETGSLYKHEQTGTAPKLDGRVYADFELAVTNNLAIIFGTSAANTTRIDNFTISSGNMNVTLASGNTPLPLHIRGNLTVLPGASLNYNPAAVTNSSLITFNGEKQQKISGNINLGVYANLEVNNPAGVELLSPLLINGNLQLSRGLVQTASGASLIFSDNATVSGASNLSFVSGKVVKTGDDAFTFPIGKNGFYAPVAISAPQNISDQYQAEYFQINPKQIFGSSVSDSLSTISDKEYWDLERLSGNSEVKVTLSYDPARSKYMPDLQNMRIAHFKNNSQWVNEGQANLTALPEFTLLQTRQTQASFSPFTFGYVGANDPLPVELVRFTAENAAGSVVLRWETASESNNHRFEIERSSNGTTFEKIGEVEGNGNSSAAKRYAFSDKNPLAGTAYYRLKQVDFDGQFSYSKIVTVQSGSKQFQLQLYPNPAQDYLTLTHAGQAIPAEVSILNTLGQTIRTIRIPNNAETYRINLSGLPAGTYLLRSDAGQQPLRFIKAN